MLGLGDRLSTYLNDHLAGSTAGVKLARRAAESNEGMSYGPVLATLAAEIQEDRQSLLDVMERLSVGQDRLKLALAWGAEKAGRLKLNGELRGYSPLSRLEELEALSLGVEGKLGLWRTLSGRAARIRGCPAWISTSSSDAPGRSVAGSRTSGRGRPMRRSASGRP